MRIKAMLLLIVYVLSFAQISSAEDTWRSSLYPVDWQPGYKDVEGRFLHDFSYAGYHKGEKDIPQNHDGATYDVTNAPYHADNSGVNDTTAAIQLAIDDAQASGGGVVYLPAGTYRVKPPEGKNEVFRVSSSNVVIKGAGASDTFIYNDDPYMRQKAIIRIAPHENQGWYQMEEKNTVSIMSDLPELTTVIPVANVLGYNIGDWVMVRTDCTAQFIADHVMTGKWNSDLGGIAFYRQITDIDTIHNTMTIDIPFRYWIKTRDNARVYKVDAHISEVGVQDLSFGMRENTKTGLGEEEYNTPGTAAYDCHASSLVSFLHTVDGWVKNVSTFKPTINTKNIHILSNGIYLDYSRNITLDNSNMQLPLYEGGGGNGYLHTIRAQECLLTNCYAYHGRHNYDFGRLIASGNVVTSSKAISGYKESDFHMHLSPANLFDNMYVDKDQLEGINRNPYGSVNKHGQTTTQSVFWNTNGISYQSGESSIVESQQFGMGYVIGTRGPANKVSVYGGAGTEPIDFVEGVGTSDNLEPQSLYLDQLDRRLGKHLMPQVIRTFPQNGKELFIHSSVYIDFDKDMDVTSVTNPSNITIEPAVNYNLSYDAGEKRCTITFLDGLNAETEYMITVKSGVVKSSIGEALYQDKTITFTATPNISNAVGLNLITSATSAQAEVTITNNQSIEMNPLLIVALYETDTKIVAGITYHKSAVGAGMTEKLHTPILHVPAKISDYYFRAFLWEGTDALNPLLMPIEKSWDELSIKTVNPIADSFTRNGGSYQTINYGSLDILNLKNGASGFYRKVYFKFDLTSVNMPIQRAKLRIYGNNSTVGATAGVSAYQITDDSWQENAITWINAPTMSTLIGSVNVGNTLQYYEIDVTSFVADQIDGDKIISIGLDTLSDKFINFNSKEAETNRPELVLEF